VTQGGGDEINFSTQICVKKLKCLNNLAAKFSLIKHKLIIVFTDFPDPVLFLPLNKYYWTRDISKNRLSTTATGVTLAAGKDGEAGGSYYFSGSSLAYVEIPNNDKTDTRYGHKFQKNNVIDFQSELTIKNMGH